MGWIGWVRCKKFRCDFVARTFSLIAPVQPVLHRVSWSNETIQNAPKYYKTHQYMHLGSNVGGSGVFIVRNSNATSCHELVHYFYHFSPLCIEFCALTKESKMHPNTTKRTKTRFYSPMGISGLFAAKNSDAASWHELLH